jgi:hypothetical protein
VRRSMSPKAERDWRLYATQLDEIEKAVGSLLA